MDRFSTRLAASLIQDRQREAAADRRSADLRSSATVKATDPARTWHRRWPIRVRAGAR